jgi:hypothetical protein
MILSKDDAWAFLEASRSFSAVLKEIMLRRSQVRRRSEARDARIAKVRLNLWREIIRKAQGFGARGYGLILVPSSSFLVPFICRSTDTR